MATRPSRAAALFTGFVRQTLGREIQAGDPPFERCRGPHGDCLLPPVVNSRHLLA